MNLLIDLPLIAWNVVVHGSILTQPLTTLSDSNKSAISLSSNLTKIASGNSPGVL